MLNLNQLNINVDFALNQHSMHLCNHIKEKLYEPLDNTKCDYYSNELLQEFINKLSDENGKQIDDVGDVINNSVEKIIESKPDNLKRINQRFKDFVNSKSAVHFNGVTYDTYLQTKKEEKSSLTRIHCFFKRLENVFSYSSFGGVEYSKYKLTENLQVRTCIYCNRMYAITHYKSDGNNLMNPQLDHWLPKSKYPLLQVSFFNLIPSCDICNSRIKKVREFKEDEHVHPYDDTYEEVKFTYHFDKNINGFKVKFENDGMTPNKVRNTFEYLLVDEMHNAHILELRDLIKIKEAYGDDYLDKLQKAFPDIKISKRDRYRLAFGVEIDPSKFHLYPLSKFKYDILIELGIIKNV